ncbi:MAG: SDR family NAD(P)-dependent oxidoreductase [Bacteroidetes bacterium]|nr:SDR family NAD(P)-dependent oxidoreductase [Bacteroidota bacterium]
MDKLCTVIGVGPGMGMAIAKKFAQEGFNLALVARRKEALAEYEKELSNKDVKTFSYPTDVSDLDQLGSTMNKIEKEAGQSNPLIYNVSVLNPSVPSKLKIEDLIQEFKINVASALVCVKKVLPFMQKAKTGKIFLTGGGLALNPCYEYVSLGIGKAAMRSLSISLSQELKQYGIHVATITIDGMIEPGGRFDPDRIAEEYWRLYNQKPGKQEIEVIYN